MPSSFGLIVFLVLLALIGRIGLLIHRNSIGAASRRSTAEMFFWACIVLFSLVATVQFSSCCESAGC